MAAGATPVGAHVVHAYRDDAEIVATVARYVADGLAARERVLVVATAAHQAGIDEVLLQYGADPGQARADGSYLTRDARETLDAFMVNGAPDARRFRSVIGGLVASAVADGSPLRIYGEMVAVLWDADDVAGALRLEELWNRLQRSQPFTLLCGYPLSALGAGELADVTRVCRLHARLDASRHYPTLPVASASRGRVRRSTVLLPVAGAVPSARRFVLEVLREWHLDHLADEAALVATELATNAVEHAGTAFRLSLARTNGGGLRLALEDVDGAGPKVRRAPPDAFGGRGVAIIDQLADEWGWDRASDGKVVWAELRAASGR